MATGFGYVRDAKPMQINWGEVGQKMTNAISAEIQDRQSRKDEIDKQLNDYQKNLLDQPQGTNAEVNRFMGDFTSDAGDAMRQAERLLKGGNLSERDFYKFRANANQGTDLMFQAAKNFNEGYDESMRRFADGESQSKENWMRQQTEGYLNFANNGAYINPLTGEVNVARRNKETGEISTKPGDFANVSELVQQSKAKYNKFDLQGSINASVKGLTQRLVQDSDGTTTKQFYQALQDGTLGEAEQKLLNDAKRDLVDSYTVNPDNVSSILTENVGVTPDGVSYDFTYDEEEAKKNEHLILVNPDGTNNFDTPNGKKQLAAAKKYAEGQFEASLGGERKDRPGLSDYEKEQIRLQEKRLDQGNKEEKNKIKKDETALTNLSKLFYGNEQDAKAASNFIRGLTGNEDLRIELQGDSMIIQRIKEDGTIETTGTISKQGGLKNFIESSVTLLGIDVNNVQDALSRSGILKDSEGNEFQPNPISLISETTVTKTPSTVDEITTMINSDVDAIEINNDQATDEEDLAQILSAALGKYNVQVSEEAAGSDVIGLKLPTGELLTVDLKQATPKSIKETIKTLILGDINKDTLIKYKGKLQGGSTQTSETGGTAR